MKTRILAAAATIAALALAATALTATAAAPAQQSGDPAQSAASARPGEKGPLAPIEAGLAVYRAEGAESAVRTWLRGGPLEGSEEAIATANLLRTIESYYGAYQTYDLVGEVEVGRATRFLYIVMNYERGPLFGRFVLYRAADGWKLVFFKLHTDANEVWPPDLLPLSRASD